MRKARGGGGAEDGTPLSVRSPFVRDPQDRAAPLRRAAEVAVAGAMVVEVALVIAMLIGVCFGFCLAPSRETTTGASMESTAPFLTDCDKDCGGQVVRRPAACVGRRDGKARDKGTGTSDGSTEYKDEDKDTDPDSDGPSHQWRTLRSVWANMKGTVYHTNKTCPHVKPASIPVDLHSLPAIIRPCKVCSRSRAGRVPRNRADEAGERGRGNGLTH